MFYSLLRGIFWSFIAVLGLVFLARRKRPRKNKYTFLAIIVSLFILSSVFPIERSFLAFSTPEEAYRYIYTYDTPVYVIGGDSTDLVYSCDDEGAYVLEIIRRSNNGWKLGYITDMKTNIYNVDQGVYLQIHKHRKTGECYLFLVCPASKEHIQDSLESEFMIDPYSEVTDEYGFVNYFAYLGKLQEQYSITINDKTYEIAVQ